MSFECYIRYAWCKLVNGCVKSHVYDLGAGLELHICQTCLRPTYWLSIKEEEAFAWSKEFASLGGPEWKWDPLLDIVKLKVGVG